MATNEQNSGSVKLLKFSGTHGKGETTFQNFKETLYAQADIITHDLSKIIAGHVKRVYDARKTDPDKENPEPLPIVGEGASPEEKAKDKEAKERGLSKLHAGCLLALTGVARSRYSRGKMGDFRSCCAELFWHCSEADRAGGFGALLKLMQDGDTAKEGTAEEYISKTEETVREKFSAGLSVDQLGCLIAGAGLCKGPSYGGGRGCGPLRASAHRGQTGPEG